MLDDGDWQKTRPFNLFAARLPISKESTSHGRFRLWCERQARVALWLCISKVRGTCETGRVCYILCGAGWI